MSTFFYVNHVVILDVVENAWWSTNLTKRDIIHDYNVEYSVTLLSSKKGVGCYDWK